jgi:hypothetical protein
MVDRDARRASRVSHRAVSGNRVDLNAIRTVRIGGRADAADVMGEPDAKFCPGAGREVSAI